MTENLEIRAYLMQILWSSTWKTFQITQLILGLGLKTSLEQFGAKAFGKGLIKPLVKNPSSNFHKQDAIFSKIMR